LLTPERRENILGVAQVREVFRSSRFGAAAGCMVLEGIVYRHKPIRVLRDEVVVFQGELESLRRFKDDLQEVRHGMECGMAVKGYNDIRVGDKIEVYDVDADKVYVTRIRLGVTTTTGDAEGDVTGEAPVPVLDGVAVEAVLDRFRGEIDQVPSMFSALKKDGRPLYELARKGIEIERPARRVTIHRLTLLAVEENEWTLEAHVSKGTYIRSLAEDIGKLLGCGAHVVMLRRLSLGPFDRPVMVTLEQVEQVLAEGGHDAIDRLLLPPWVGIADWPRVELSENAAYYLRHGQPVRCPGAPSDGEVLVFGQDGTFLGIGAMDDEGRVAPRRLIRALA
jgi:tRNA pseudouridine55 synthase